MNSGNIVLESAFDIGVRTRYRDDDLTVFAGSHGVCLFNSRDQGTEGCGPHRGDQYDGDDDDGHHRDFVGQDE